MNISVVGGGPSGMMAAHGLAESGYSVDVFEENPQIGIPCHCTGLVTKVLWDLIPRQHNLILNELKGVCVHAPNGSEVTIPLQEFVLDRAGLDKFLADRAVKAGVTLHPEHRFLHFDGKDTVFKFKNESVKKQSSIVIGADGARSAVGKAAGLLNRRKYYFGIQVTGTGKFDPEIFHVWFGKVCPDFFGWVVPESSTVARVGIASQHQPQKFFEPFMQKHIKTVLSYQGGPIPSFCDMSHVGGSDPRVYLVGDAGGLVKNTTGGGIITGMLSGKLCADAITNEKNYETLLKPLKKELWIHQKLRDTLNKFGDDDYNSLITSLQDEKVKGILSAHPREYPSKFLFKLLLAKPSLTQFVKHLF